MLGIFIGEHSNKVDGKGRLSIPADFRKELESGDPAWEEGRNASMLVSWGDQRRDYVEVLPIKRLMKLRKQIARMPNKSRSRGDLVSAYIRRAAICTVDETGRIVLPRAAREKLGLDGTALVVGDFATFRIYHPDNYDDDMQAGEAEPDYDPEADPSIYIWSDDEFDEEEY